jgi:hypothetical protein
LQYFVPWIVLHLFEDALLVSREGERLSISRSLLSPLRPGTVVLIFNIPTTTVQPSKKELRLRIHIHGLARKIWRVWFPFSSHHDPFNMRNPFKRSKTPSNAPVFNQQSQQYPPPVPAQYTDGGVAAYQSPAIPQSPTSDGLLRPRPTYGASPVPYQPASAAYPTPPPSSLSGAHTERALSPAIGGNAYGGMTAMVTGEREVDSIDEGKLSVGYVVLRTRKDLKLMRGLQDRFRVSIAPLTV